MGRPRRTRTVISVLSAVTVVLVGVLVLPHARYLWNVNRLDSDDSERRVAAAWWLARYEPRRSIRPLIRTWIRAHPEQTQRVRDELNWDEFNAEALALLAASAAAPDLLAALAVDTSEKDSVRIASFRMLCSVGFYGLRDADEATVAKLAGAYEYSNVEEQFWIAYTLSSYARSTGTRFDQLLKPILEHELGAELQPEDREALERARSGLRHTLVTEYSFERRQEDVFRRLWMVPSEPSWLSSRWTIAHPTNLQEWLTRFRRHRPRSRTR